MTAKLGVAMLIMVVAVLSTAEAAPIHVNISSPLPVEYNIVNGVILVHIDTNYVVPNAKYSATAEIERNTTCNGCYTIYVVLHTPATPGYAWIPRKLAPIVAAIRPGATEKNITIRIVPIGAIKNAQNPEVAMARCSYIAAKILHLRAEVTICNALGCNKQEWEELEEEWNTIWIDNIKMRCNLNVQRPVISTQSKRGGTLRKYVSSEENIISIKKAGPETIIETERHGKLFGMFPVSVRSKIIVREHSVKVEQPLWYSLFGWMIW